MANLRLAMDAAFWDVSLSSPQSLEGMVKAVPGEPIPLDGERASKMLRPQQLSILGEGFPLGVIPSVSPSLNKEYGSFSLQSFLPAAFSPDWWAGIIGQFRPKKILLALKREVECYEGLDLNAIKEFGNHFIDKSLFSLGMFSQMSVAEDTSLFFNVEQLGERKGPRGRAMIIHQLPDHEITLDAAWHELFRDRSGTYWDVPSSISLDLSSLASKSGLRYRVGLHGNGGRPEAVNSTSDKPPLALFAGLCAKVAFSYEKSKDLWREREENNSEENSKKPWLSSYDVRLSEPHAAISAIIGGSYAAWFGGNNGDASVKKRAPFSGDLFGALCYTFQHGKFKNDFMDLSRIDARLDISSATSFIKGANNLISDIFRNQVKKEADPLSSPRFSVILQQQVAGPIVFRVDSKFSFGSSSGKCVPHTEDIIYGLSYSLRILESGKVFAWYSPKRKEAMIELRYFEF